MKSLEGHDGTDQPLGVEFGNRASLRHDVPISKIGGKIHEAIENLLKEAFTKPMDKRHGTDALGPLHPLGIVDEGDKMHQNLTENGLGANCWCK
jgi:hypothetical protein